jgi:hypothetical protein
VRLDHVGAQARLAQRGPQPRDEGLQRIRRVAGRVTVPEPFDQRAGGHHPAGVEGQQDQQHADAVPADPHRSAGLVLHREGSQ